MSKPQIPREVTLERERQIWQLRSQFKTQDEIAVILGLDQSTISRMLKRVSKRANTELIDQVMQVKMQQASQLEYIALEAMRAWEKSKEPSKQTSMKTKTVGNSKGRKIEERGINTETQYGDARYLTSAMKALSDIRDIFGLNAPIKLDIALALIERFVTITREIGIDPAEALQDYAEALLLESTNGNLTNSKTSDPEDED